MPHAKSPALIAAVRDPLPTVDADIVVVPWFEDEAASAVPGVDAAVGGEVARALASKEFDGKRYDVFLAPVVDRQWRARRVMLIGAGRRAEADGDLLRKLASTAGREARTRRVARAAFVPRGVGNPADLAQ